MNSGAVKREKNLRLDCGSFIMRQFCFRKFPSSHADGEMGKAEEEWRRIFTPHDFLLQRYLSQQQRIFAN